MTTMRQDAQKQSQKFCRSKEDKNGETHPVWAEKGETGCVLGAGEGGSGWERMKTGGKAQCLNHITVQHMKKGNRRKPSVFAGFLAGAEGLEPSARGFGVDVEERKRERGRGGVARFLLQDENVRCWFGAFRFSRSKTRIESPLEISLRMSSLKSYICMYTEE